MSYNNPPVKFILNYQFLEWVISSRQFFTEVRALILISWILRWQPHNQFYKEPVRNLCLRSLEIGPALQWRWRICVYVMPCKRYAGGERSIYVYVILFRIIMHIIWRCLFSDIRSFVFSLNNTIEEPPVGLFDLHISLLSAQRNCFSSHLFISLMNKCSLQSLSW